MRIGRDSDYPVIILLTSKLLTAKNLVAAADKDRERTRRVPGNNAPQPEDSDSTGGSDDRAVINQYRTPNATAIPLMATIFSKVAVLKSSRITFRAITRMVIRTIGRACKMPDFFESATAIE